MVLTIGSVLTALIALLGIAVIVTVVLNIMRKQKKAHPHSTQRYESPSPASSGFHRGTVLMDGERCQSNIPSGRIHIGCLRHYGDGNWPGEIKISLQDGGVFTIGRYDSTLGQQISDFEFEPSRKTVSRRHAEIACDSEGFMIQDLDSTGGTVVNGVLLEPRTYYRLMEGFHVSFASAGADYIWHDFSEGANRMEV